MLAATAHRMIEVKYFTLSIRAQRLVHNQLAIFYTPPLFYLYTLMLDNNNIIIVPSNKDTRQ